MIRVKLKYGIILILSFLSLPFLSLGQRVFDGDFSNLFTPVRTMVVYHTNHPIVIDGKGHEKDWREIPWSAPFIDIEGKLKPKPLYMTRVKLLWDRDNLYVLAQMDEPDLWAYLNIPDEIVYHENDFEIFIDPDENGQDYFEFELNARNNLFDLFLPKPYRNGGRPLVTYHAIGFESAVHLDGTLNNATDRDKGWQVEVKIPFEDLRADVNSVVPVDGQQWRINFSRVEWQTTLKNGKYERKKDNSGNHLLPEYNWVWSAPGIISMHAPERYGIIQFSSQEATHHADVTVTPKLKDHLSQYLWLIYYKEYRWKKIHQCFVSDFPDLFTENEKVWSPESGVSIRLEATSLQFTALLYYNGKLYSTLNDQGLLKF